jgi:fatty-acyl-CoA synthase
MDVIVADPATGAECPPARFDAGGRMLNGHDAIGELVNRAGARLFEGYYRNDEAQAERVRDGWYWSGDLAYRDEEGWFYFAGRGADWLRVDSENFAAAPVERILARWAPVVMAAVYPVPDVRTGDQVMAAFELAEGTAFDPEAFVGFLDRQPDLGTKWAPRYVRVVPAMPLTANNKVDKRPLREEAWEGDDRVWWRPAGGDGYRPLGTDDRDEHRRQLAAHGRAHLLGRATAGRT